MNKSYANAADVLPSELVEQIKQHYTGVLYIPDKKRTTGNRELVIAMAKTGATSAEIANVTGLTVRRVNQIVSHLRRENGKFP